MSHPLVVEPEDLMRQLGDPSIRVLDATVFLEAADAGYRAVSGFQRYRDGHIPGAAFLDLIHGFSDPTSGLGFTKPAPAALAEAIGNIGVGAEHPVVVYSGGHLMWATRAFWLLRYAGHGRVSVLNGGLRGWHDAGGAVAGGIEVYPQTVFHAEPRSEMFVDLAETRAAMRDAAVCTVNALSPEVYAGTGPMHYGRRGHIPGSRNLPYDQLTDGRRLRAADELRDVLDASGLLAAPRVISYCGGGISATIDALACLLVGKTDVAVYDGSMSEWARDASLPLTTGRKP